MSRALRLSPTMLSTWERDPGRGAWIKTYVLGVREEQTEAMAAGSAFDSFVKTKLRGMPTSSPLDWGVSPANHEFGLRIGAYLLDDYIRLGAYESLMGELDGADFYMEEDLSACVEGVPLGGKPDLFWWGSESAGTSFLRSIDWKVSQITKADASPFAGYRKLWIPPSVTGPKRNSTMLSRGLYTHDSPSGLDQYEDQQIMYAWLCGAPVGSPLHIGIDRLFGMPIRVSTYRWIVGPDKQAALLKRIRVAWDGIQALLADTSFLERVKAQPEIFLVQDDCAFWSKPTIT